MIGRRHTNAGAEVRGAEVSGQLAPTPAETTGSEGSAGGAPFVEPIESRVHLFPDVFVSALSSMALLLCLYSLLCIFAPAMLDVRANTFAAPVQPRPAWYFLFLYRYLRSVPPLVGAVTPVAVVVLLGALPFIDRNPSRLPRTRALALSLGALAALGVIVLSYLGRVS